MKQVTRWVKAVALARYGFNEGEINDLLRAREVPQFAVERLGEAGVARINALTELQLNYTNMAPDQFAEAMTVAHFSNYFADALSRMFYDDYQLQASEWRNYVRMDTTPDGRDVKRMRMTRQSKMHRRAEKERGRYGYIDEGTPQTYGWDEYEDNFDVSWRAILNDDLGKIRETPQAMLNGVTSFEDEFVSALYDNATTQAALVALGALYAGTGRLTAANLAIGINAMMQRTDPAGKKLKINRVHLVIPPILRIQARVVLESVLMPGVATNDKNVLKNFIAGVHVDPEIATSGPDIPWYLFADPSEIPTVTVVRQQGFDRPWVSQKQSNIALVTGSAPSAYLMGSFETGDIEYKVTDLIGGWDDTSYVGVTDFRGIYYSSGTTP